MADVKDKIIISIPSILSERRPGFVRELIKQILDMKKRGYSDEQISKLQAHIDIVTNIEEEKHHDKT